MYHDTDEFNRLMGEIESKSTPVAKKKVQESTLDLSKYGMEPIHEGILQNGINKVSNLLSANLKSKISNEWKHLSEDERTLLLRIISGNNSVFDEENSNVDVALARAFKEGSLSATKDAEGVAAIVVNKSVDLSNAGAEKFPMLSIEGVNGGLKCSYSAFKTFVGFPKKVQSLEFVKGRSLIQNMAGAPEVVGKDESNYSINLSMTKIDSLKGWKQKSPIKGHVSLRGCDLKDIAVDSPLYITGSLDLRDNSHISIESLKSILLKDYSNNQIIVKGKIYHTLEADGFYSSKKIKDDSFTADDLGPLTEAVNRAGASMTQEELWKIGPEIIRQAEEKKAKKQNASPKDTIAQKVKPEVQNLVSSIASSQLGQQEVAAASKKIVSGMSSDEFRELMKGLFSNLLKQLTVMMRDSGNSDSSQVEKSIDTIAKVTAESVAEKMEAFAKEVDGELHSDGCLDIDGLAGKLEEIIQSLPEVGTADLKTLEHRLTVLRGYKADRNKYTAGLTDFVNLLNVGILGQSEVADSLITKNVNACFGEEEAVKSNEPPAVEDSGPSEVAPEQVSAEATPEEQVATPVENTVEPQPAETQPEQNSQGGKVAGKKTSAKKPAVSLRMSDTAVSPKSQSGLNRFMKIVGGGSVNTGNSEG